MGIEAAKSGKLLYHLTEVDNLPSIITNNLVARKILLDNSTGFEDVANPDIISKRTILGLDNYVPFHFHPYSAFDVAVKGTYPDVDFIYICITRELAKQNDFKILPMHPLSLADYNGLFDFDEGFQRIDWDTLMERGRTDEYAKHVKMAECLTDKTIPVAHFHSIVVKDQKMKQHVEYLLNEGNANNPPPYVNIQNWF
ncbi:MAG: hypothetical protein H6Q60_19 [Oscillospiraceae bacterium]|nr:hypothetical protein [Oscillospiraceae bacterium]